MVLLWVKFGTERRVLFPREFAVLKGIVLRREKSQGKWTISVVFYRCKKQRARSGVLERALAHAGARSAFAQRPLGTRSGRTERALGTPASTWSTPRNNLDSWRNAMDGTRGREHLGGTRSCRKEQPEHVGGNTNSLRGAASVGWSLEGGRTRDVRVLAHDGMLNICVL
ncbi:hypothetical protein B0H12DRAFT_1081266 [Mycena haematopus]|nr:hypothetical protein B0H12DRAFT_1081266 [Mycena haematopus]